MPDAPDLLKPVDQWNAARSLIDHYQSVLNQRFTWVSALEGFVFTAFALTVNAATNAKTETLANLLWGGVIAISVVGATVPWLFVPALNRYGQRLQEVRKYWENLAHTGFPPLQQEPSQPGWRRLENLPYLTSVAWILAMVFGFVALSLKTVPTSP